MKILANDGISDSGKKKLEESGFDVSTSFVEQKKLISHVRVEVKTSKWPLRSKYYPIRLFFKRATAFMLPERTLQDELRRLLRNLIRADEDIIVRKSQVFK